MNFFIQRDFLSQTMREKGSLIVFFYAKVGKIKILTERSENRMNTVNNAEPEGPILCGIICIGACAVLCTPDGVSPILDFYGVSAYAPAEAGTA